MIIRYLTEGDVVEHDKITSQAFSYSCNIGDESSVLPCEKVLGAFDDDNSTLFADFEIIDKECYYDGKILRCAAIGGVAAKPEHRGKGAVKELFRYLFRETDHDISILYPFSEEYYRKFGYERIGRCICATVPFSVLTKVKRNSDAVLYEGRETERLLGVYNKCAQFYNLCFARNSAEAYSNKPYFSQQYTYIHKDNSYATIRIDREKSTVFVQEIYFDSYDSMLGILGFLRNFESNQKKISFQKLPWDTPLLSVFTELEDCDIRVLSAGAARILNAESVLKSHRYPAGKGSFTLRIGEEVFGVRYSEKGVVTEKDPSLSPEVITDVNTGSRILLSGLGAPGYEPGLVVNDPDSDFFKAFPPKTTFFTDGF